MFEGHSKSACYWTETAKDTAPRFTPLPGDLDVDVAVIGGGIVGMTTAARLREKGKSVAVLEASRVGQQTTGRSTAKVTVQHKLIYRRLIDDFGKEKAQIYADANQAALEEIAALIMRHNIECEFTRQSAWVYARTAEHEDELRSETAAARQLGLPATFSQDAPLPFYTSAAMEFSGQAQFHPCRYVAGLAQSLAAAGCWVFEDTRVTEIDDGKPCRVMTEHGVITARDVVMATHMPIGMTGMYFAKAFPYAEPVIAARIDSDRAPHGMFISAEKPTHSVRAAPAPGGGTMLIAVGNSFSPGHGDEEQESFKDLLIFARENFGVITPDYHWTNEDYRPMDGVPFIGRCAGHEDHVYVATGFNAWGITTGTAAGMIIADLVVDGKNPWADFFDATRIRPLRSGKSFLRGNMHAGRHLVHGRFEDRPHNVMGLQPGEGRIIKQHDETIAVSRDDDGELHAVSAACTHMGCILGWNAADRTWDCTCHGSRFACDGKMLHGPATADLEKKELQTETRPAPEGDRPRT